MLKLTSKKDIILQNIFSSNTWTNQSKNNELILKQINDSYYEQINEYTHINSIQELKENIQCGCLIRYFTYDGDIRFGGILLKKIFIKKNEIDDAILLLKNSNGQTWKFHFNNFIVFYKNTNRNQDLRNIFLNYVPDNINEDFQI